LPDGNGIDLLSKIKKISPNTTIFIITGWGNIELAVEAMRQGATDFLIKPLDMNSLVTRVRSWRRELSKLNQGKLDENNFSDGFTGVIGKTGKMQKAIEMMERVAPSDVAVMIRGETGTGKELIARGIHSLSNRRRAPFISVNCAAIPEHLIESELFGYERGAFTGAVGNKKGKFLLAQGGTIFLDEIGDLDFGLQAKLLRVLQDRKIEPLGSEKSIDLDVRIITATNKPLELMVQEGHFRQDLYYRISVLTITLPTLRERIIDLAEFANYFIQMHSKKQKKIVVGLADGVLDLLKSYNWPGNIREFSNVIERAVVLSQGTKLTHDDFNIPALKAKAKINNSENAIKSETERIEKEKLQQALTQTDGNQARAAKLLGIKRTTLRYKMQKYKLIDI